MYPPSQDQFCNALVTLGKKVVEEASPDEDDEELACRARK